MRILSKFIVVIIVSLPFITSFDSVIVSSQTIKPLQSNREVIKDSIPKYDKYDTNDTLIDITPLIDINKKVDKLLIESKKTIGDTIQKKTK